eukprot:344039_1
MPRHNANRLLSLRKSFLEDDSCSTHTIPRFPLSTSFNVSINLLDTNHNNANKEDAILTDASLSAMEFDDLDSVNSFAHTNATSVISSCDASVTHSELSEGLSQDNYNHLLSQPSTLQADKSGKAPPSMHSSRAQRTLKKQLRLEWIAKDKAFNQWLKEKPPMEHITHFNDDLNGNKHAEYTNFEFVWVKLRFTKQQRTQTQITCCWWPAQISLPFDQET